MKFHFIVLKALHIIIALFVIVLAAYGYFANQDEVLPYVMTLLGVMLLVVGLSEMKQHRKTIAVICFAASLFIFFVVFF
ncbi:DUF3953 domain-containing protein [Bacillus sp. FJAT-47783]|uniref:DUF3953 domain-containing protein n=1 Tax=Bacillus sp. FJAT-47783 TaxID=2922712 RepID=UPI001FABD8A5|nr:DUF3953 domain-containing protein [Bacillus sp. FJAT-47783]